MPVGGHLLLLSLVLLHRGHACNPLIDTPMHAGPVVNNVVVQLSFVSLSCLAG